MFISFIYHFFDSEYLAKTEKWIYLLTEENCKLFDVLHASSATLFEAPQIWKIVFEMNKKKSKSKQTKKKLLSE